MPPPAFYDPAFFLILAEIFPSLFDVSFVEENSLFFRGCPLRASARQIFFPSFSSRNFFFFF